MGKAVFEKSEGEMVIKKERPCCPNRHGREKQSSTTKLRVIIHLWEFWLDMLIVVIVCLKNSINQDYRFKSIEIHIR